MVRIRTVHVQYSTLPKGSFYMYIFYIQRITTLA